MTLAAPRAHPDRGEVLAEALLAAGHALGLTQADIGEVIGKDRTAVSRGTVSPDSKAGELALLLIRVYRSLYVLVDGTEAAMRHWMRTPNHGTGGIPAEQIRTVAGLVRVVEYLDAMRGKA